MTIQFTIRNQSPAAAQSDCLILGIFDDKELDNLASEIDQQTGGLITAVLADDFKAQLGETLIIRNTGTEAKRILLTGLGKRNKLDLQRYSQAITAATKAVAKTASESVINAIPLLNLDNLNNNQKVKLAAIASKEALYRFTQMKSKAAKDHSNIATIELCSSGDRTEALEQGLAIGSGISFAKDLGNLPGNICTPTYLAEQALLLAKKNKPLKTTILEESDMEKLGMGSLLSVSRGSRQPAKLIVMEYNGGKKGDAPHALVGKGLTFDAGGISIKPSSGMDEMKYDMCGGASVFGTMQAICEMQLPLNVVAVVPSSENLPDGEASKPGDIVTTMKGLTVEVLNTDAEGRLILCDALTYTEKFKPKTVIDIATLTGACVVALGEHASAMYVNNDDMADSLSTAAKTSGDRIWPMPLWDDYQKQLKSNFADMANIGGPKAGSVTAACFLSRFTENFTWAHLDIAGTAWKSGAAKGATGRPVSLLTQYLIDQIS